MPPLRGPNQDHLLCQMNCGVWLYQGVKACCTVRPVGIEMLAPMFKVCGLPKSRVATSGEPKAPPAPQLPKTWESKTVCPKFCLVPPDQAPKTAGMETFQPFCIASSQLWLWQLRGATWHLGIPGIQTLGNNQLVWVNHKQGLAEYGQRPLKKGYCILTISL